MANSYKGNTIRVDTTPANAIITGSGRVIGVVLVGGSAVADVKLYDALTVTGDPIFEFGNVAIDTTDGVTGLNIDFTKGLTVATVGAAAIAYIYLD